MFPQSKRQKEGSVSSDVDHIKRESDDGAEEYDVLHSAAEDLLKAIESKNVKSVAEALRAAFELCDLEPHEEGPHV